MALYRAGNAWGVDYRDEYGRRHRKAVGSQEAAAVIEERIKEQVAKAKQSVSSFALGQHLTIRQARDIWLTTTTAGKERRKKLGQSIELLARHASDIEAAHVTPKLLEEYAAARKAVTSPQTHAKENGALKQFFGWLAKEWFLPSNPAAALDSHYPRTVTGIAISYAEEKEILAHTRTANTRLKLLLALDGGLRVKEITLLRREHWNRDEQILSVWASKTRTTRLIPLTRRLEAELEAASGETIPGSRLTRSSTTNPSSAASFLRKRPNPLGRIRFHDLRHTFISRAAAVSKPHVTRALAGHAPRTTTDYYTHASLEELRAAIRAIEAANPLTASYDADPTKHPTHQPERSEAPMPGKRYNLRIKGEDYGPLNGERARAAEDQSGASQGSTWVIPQSFEARILVKLTDLQIIEQKTTLPNVE